jgi:hypothetical protein
MSLVIKIEFYVFKKKNPHTHTHTYIYIFVTFSDFMFYVIEYIRNKHLLPSCADMSKINK